jgi:nicotinamide-nucleotide amidase
MHGTAELIFTGDELLRGDIVNTNQAFLGECLLDAGLFTTHALSVTDDVDAIASALQAALIRRPDVVILSGGLGPTEDDLTREAVSSALGRPLEHHDELLVQIQARFTQLGIHMGDSNRKQALIPEGATAIPFIGTAPGFWLVSGDTLVAALPGVPRELATMWTETVEPVLKSRLRGPEAKDGRPVPGVIVRRLRVYGIGESTLAELLSDTPWRGHGVDIGTRAALDGLTLILRAQPTAEAHAMLAQIEEQVRDILGTKIYGTGDADLAGVVGGLLRDRGLTVATAESCTGGLVAKRLTDVPGSSDYFLGGVVAYSNRLKTALLDVGPALLDEHGAVSEEVAAAMAVGACKRLGADCAISTTGIAGPGGGSAEKPVGLVYVGTALGDDVQVRSFTMFRSREEIRIRTAQTALDVFRRRFLDPLDR